MNNVEWDKYVSTIAKNMGDPILVKHPKVEIIHKVKLSPKEEYVNLCSVVTEFITYYKEIEHEYVGKKLLRIQDN